MGNLNKSLESRPALVFPVYIIIAVVAFVVIDYFSSGINKFSFINGAICGAVIGFVDYRRLKAKADSKADE